MTTAWETKAQNENVIMRMQREGRQWRKLKSKCELHAADSQEGVCDEREHGEGAFHKWHGDPTRKASPQVFKGGPPAFFPSHSIC